MVEYLNFSAYEELALEVAAISAAFPSDILDVATELKRMTRLRNHVAHPTKPITLVFDPPDLARLAGLAETVLTNLRGTAADTWESV